MFEMLQGVTARLPDGELLIASPLAVSPWAWVPVLISAALLLVLREARRARTRVRPRSGPRREQSRLRQVA